MSARPMIEGQCINHKTLYLLVLIGAGNRRLLLVGSPILKRTSNTRDRISPWRSALRVFLDLLACIIRSISTCIPCPLEGVMHNWKEMRGHLTRALSRMTSYAHCIACSRNEPLSSSSPNMADISSVTKDSLRKRTICCCKLSTRLLISLRVCHFAIRSTLVSILLVKQIHEERRNEIGVSASSLFIPLVYSVACLTTTASN